MNQPQSPPAGSQSGGDRLERCGLPFSVEVAGQSGKGRLLEEGSQCWWHPCFYIICSFLDAPIWVELLGPQ